MATITTWRLHTQSRDIDPNDRDKLPHSVYAFPRHRKEPLTDASSVRNALVRFDQVFGVNDADRDLAFANIKKAAEHFGVAIPEERWEELGKKTSV